MGAITTKTRDPKPNAAIHILISSVETIQLEVRLKALDQSYTQLLRKKRPTYEDLNELLVDLRKITKSQGIDRVENIF